VVHRQCTPTVDAAHLRVFRPARLAPNSTAVQRLGPHLGLRLGSLRSA
jgi:hypothetical protein